MRYHSWYRIFFYIMKEKKSYTEILIKLERYCKYQERCKSEIENKLKKLEATEKIKDSIISELSDKNYFDNMRFSCEYAIGKFRNNLWGRIKIRYNLKCKLIEKKVIDEALKKIPEDEYILTFNKMAMNEWTNRSQLDSTTRIRRFYKTLQSRGWEFDLIKNFLFKIRKDKF